MQINFRELRILERRLSEVIGELTCQREKIKEVILLMKIHGQSHNLIADLKKNQEKMAQQILVAMKMKEAVKRISAIYMTGEEVIESYIDEGLLQKREFRFCTIITDNSDFDWSIE